MVVGVEILPIRTTTLIIVIFLNNHVEKKTLKEVDAALKKFGL